MKCASCGADLNPGDVFCGICGASAGGGAQAPAPQQPAAPGGPPQQPMQPPAPQPPRQQPAKAKKRAAKKKKAPVKKAIAGEKKGGKGLLIVLLVVLLLAAAGAAVYFFVLSNPGDMKMKKTTLASQPAKLPQVNMPEFAARLCSIAVNQPRDIDSVYSFEFHALMSASPERLDETGYSVSEYVELAEDNVRKQMEKQGYRACSECEVVKAQNMECDDMYRALEGALSQEKVPYSYSDIKRAGDRLGVTGCGVIVLGQSWPDSETMYPQAYFTGRVHGDTKVLQYFVTDYLN